MKNAIKLAAPWIIYYQEIEALFAEDPAVRVEYDDATYTIKLYVEGTEKADALAQLLQPKKTFGNIVVTVNVLPANVDNEPRESLFQKIFEGNPVFSRVQASENPVFDFSYVVFKKKVAQFYSDNMADVNGMTSTLYQEIARDVFKPTPGVYFCTESEEQE